MSEEITTEEALDSLVDGQEKIVAETDQSLPKLRFAVQQFENVPRYKAPLSAEREVRYDRWEVDEALTNLRNAVGSWAEEQDYEINDIKTEVFDEPIDEQLAANFEGEIDTDNKKIEFGFHGGRKTRKLEIDPVNRTDRPGLAITAGYDGFDGSMTEEYRELNAVTEAIMSKYGRIVKHKPDSI